MTVFDRFRRMFGRGSPKRASWSVVSTISEAPQIVASFAAYYLASDAEEIFIFLDTPNEDARYIAELFAQHPRIRTQICDKAYWKKVGRRPHGASPRQIENARQAYGMCKSDWLLNCDADEFLVHHEEMGRLLAECDEAVDFAVVPVIERVHVPGDDRSQVFSSAFRTPMKPSDPEVMEDLYGSFAPMLKENIAAHSLGKSFNRCHRDVLMRVHTPNDLGHGNYVGTDLSGVAFAHFDGFSEYSLILKYLRKMKGQQKKGALFDAYKAFKKREASGTRTELDALKEEKDKLEKRFAIGEKRNSQMMRLMEICGDPDQLHEFYTKLKSVDEAQVAKLEALDLLEFHDLKVDACLERYFSKADVPLDVETFDAAFAKTVE